MYDVKAPGMFSLQQKWILFEVYQVKHGLTIFPGYDDDEIVYLNCEMHDPYVRGLGPTAGLL